MSELEFVWYLLWYLYFGLFSFLAGIRVADLRNKKDNK